MTITIADSYQDLSRQAAEELLHLLLAFDQPLICTASGASPAGLYEEVTRRVGTSAVDTSNWYFVGLDEWKGMNGSDEGSSRHQLDRQLFQSLHIEEERVCFFDGRAEDPEEECRRVDDYIRQHGGIDVAILGIGVNGHIAMNEPGTPASLRAHVAAIHPDTQQIGQKYFKEPRQLDAGLTLGLATLLEAKHILLLACGASKAGSIHRMLHDPVGEELPATVLRDHPGLHILVDAEAASLLR